MIRQRYSTSLRFYTVSVSTASSFGCGSVTVLLLLFLIQMLARLSVMAYIHSLVMPTDVQAISCFFADCSCQSTRAACAIVVVAARLYSPDHWVFDTLREKVEIISSEQRGRGKTRHDHHAAETSQGLSWCLRSSWTTQLCDYGLGAGRFA